MSGTGSSSNASDGGSRARFRIAFVIFLILTGAVIAYALFMHPRLPERVPVHFDLQGNPDRWSSPMELTGVLVGVSAFFLLLFGLLPLFMTRLPPSLWNLPHRDYWLAPTRKEGTARVVSMFCFRIGSLTSLFFLLLHQAVISVAIGKTERLTFGLGETLVYLALVLGLSVALYARFRKIPEPGA